MMQRRIRIGCGFTFAAAADTPVIFQVRPGEPAGLAVDGEQRPSQPPMAIRCHTDLYGNPRTRAVLPAGRSRSGYHAAATVPDAAERARVLADCPGPGRRTGEAGRRGTFRAAVAGAAGGRTGLRRGPGTKARPPGTAAAARDPPHGC
jgi:hypothetical protein